MPEDWLKFEFERLNNCIEDLRKDVQNLSIDIAKLKIKAGVWGILGGAIPVVIMIGAWIIIQLV